MIKHGFQMDDSVVPLLAEFLEVVIRHNNELNEAYQAGDWEWFNTMAGGVKMSCNRIIRICREATRRLDPNTQGDPALAFEEGVAAFDIINGLRDMENSVWSNQHDDSASSN